MISMIGISFGNDATMTLQSEQLDTRGGLFHYDFEARWYDPVFPAFTSVDPMAEKYPHLSLYVYCAGNPIRYIDPSGEDVAILNYGYHFNQHLAMLIQNQDGRWQYYSINGNNLYVSGYFSGGRKFNDVGVGDWSSPEEFINSDYNSEGDGDDENINSYGFSEAYVIESTEEQDEIMRNTFKEISETEEYKLLSNNCATTVERVLDKAGIETFDKGTETIKIPANHKYGFGDITITRNKKPENIPSKAFKNIQKYNPNGRLIKKTKK